MCMRGQGGRLWGDRGGWQRSGGSTYFLYCPCGKRSPCWRAGDSILVMPLVIQHKVRHLNTVLASSVRKERHTGLDTNHLWWVSGRKINQKQSSSGFLFFSFFLLNTRQDYTQGTVFKPEFSHELLGCTRLIAMSTDHLQLQSQLISSLMQLPYYLTSSALQSLTPLARLVFQGCTWGGGGQGLCTSIHLVLIIIAWHRPPLAGWSLLN